MAQPLVCPQCRRELRPTRDPRRVPVVVSCQCGLQLLCQPHERRLNRIRCTVLKTPEEILLAWTLVRSQM